MPGAEPPRGRSRGPIPEVPGGQGVHDLLIERRKLVVEDPDAAARPAQFTTTAPPERWVDLTPTGWHQRPGSPPVTATGQTHDLLAPPPGTDRLVSVGAVNRLRHLNLAAPVEFMRSVQLAEWAVWTVVAFEHPAGRRWDPSRRLGERRLVAGGWSGDLDVLKCAAAAGWRLRSAQRTSARVAGATYDLVIADIWRAPPLAEGFEELPRELRPGS